MDSHMVGLFDFEIDGEPEIVVQIYDEAQRTYTAEVFDLSGTERFTFDTGHTYPDLQLYSCGGRCPCFGGIRMSSGQRTRRATTTSRR